jgi:dTDP-4-dehydrorhamnose 3,5-epimerase-like enzyme
MKQANQTLIKLPRIYDDAFLSFLESKRHIPFQIKRVYVIYKCSAGLDRGHHVHKKTHQVIFCLQGEFDLYMDDGRRKKTIHVKKPNVGVYIPPYVWHEMRKISKDAILLVVASKYYDERDYVRNYKDFIAVINKNS